ncbi:MAG: primosomal protein N' [Verrucomicrobiota bacterium]
MEKSYVRVVPELSLDRCFDYTVPAQLQSSIELGYRLRVPWGRSTTLAYAVDFPETPEVESCRDILELIGSHPLLNPELVKLARWIAEYYCCDFPLALKGFLPEVIRKKETNYKTRYWVSVPAHLVEEEVLKMLGKAKAQKRVWKFAQKKGAGWLATLMKESKSNAGVWNALAEKGFIRLSREKMERNPLNKEIQESIPLLLTKEQTYARRRILQQASSDQPKALLLQGVTGSGKTEVYLQAIEEILKQGKSVLVLVPEISLTSQTVNRFRARFEGQQIRVAVLHSHLSSGERHDQWHAIHQGKAKIVIGARSAVFAPVQKLGLIIVDEEHESSYKQEEAPHYHARDVAVMRSYLEKVPVVLGSATPSLESVLNARRERYILCKLTQRAEKMELPTIHVLDLRQEKGQRQGGFLMAQCMKEAVETRLMRQEQCILFLNRRGFATSVQCPNCGRVCECPRCSVPLTYHRTSNLMRCHFCDYQDGLPKLCEECGFEQQKYGGFGTQRVEDAVQHLFPKARWQRMDSDSMRGKYAYEEALTNFRSGRTDILVGTQMIAKGLHFPNVTCVGVVNCDSALNLPDFRAAERVFQQLVQVAGRAGRGDQLGEVFIQTYTPFHPAIQFARHHDVEGFQEQELEFRKDLMYPPYCRSVLVMFRGKSEEKTRYCIEQATKRIRERLQDQAMVSEMAPAPIEKLRDEYRFHTFIRTQKILRVSQVLREEIKKKIWPEGVKVSVNVDPVNLL